MSSLHSLAVPKDPKDASSGDEGDEDDSEVSVAAVTNSDIAQTLSSITTAMERLTSRMDNLEGARVSTQHHTPRHDIVQGDVESVVRSMRGMRSPVPPPSSGPSIRDVLLRGVSGAGGGRSRRGRDRRVQMDSSDSSDSDGDEETKGRRTSSRSKTVADERIAATVLKRLLKNHTSAVAFVRSNEFKNSRNMHEARRTAQAIDAFLREGVSAKFEGMEILVRALTGLYKSDQHSQPSLLEELEWAPPEDILPREIFRVVAKDAARRTKQTTKSKPQAPPKGAGAKGK